MTRPTKKARERFFVEEAAKHLGVVWSLGSVQESPDFIVNEALQAFGLEVCEIFTGPQNRAGSSMKRAESVTQRDLNRLRLEYEATNQIPLIVKFVGDLSMENVALIVPALVAEDFASKPIRHHVVIDHDNGLRVHVTKSFRPDWHSINHRVGWVDRNPVKRISDVIENKAKELPRYRAAGTDIRLLIVADRTHNSGKLLLNQHIASDLHGFSVVYFFSYPQSVTVLHSAATAA
jgi:hypothetical protein